MNYVCWLVVSTPLKNMKVSWDDFSQYMEQTVPNHQPGIYVCKCMTQLAQYAAHFLTFQTSL